MCCKRQLMKAKLAVLPGASYKLIFSSFHFLEKAKKVRDFKCLGHSLLNVLHVCVFDFFSASMKSKIKESHKR